MRVPERPDEGMTSRRRRSRSTEVAGKINLGAWRWRGWPGGARGGTWARPVDWATLVVTLQPKDILEAALKLPTEQREELIEELSASLDAADLGEYWEAEIQRRVADVDAGNVKTVPADEVYARLRQHFSAK